MLKQAFKQKLLIFSFTLFNILLIAFSFIFNYYYQTLQNKKTSSADIKPSSLSQMSNVDLFKLKGDQKLIDLNATKVSLEAEASLSSLINPKGNMFTKDGEKVEFSALRGNYIGSKEMLSLINNVRLKTKDAQIDADEMNYYKNKNSVVAQGEVATQTYVAKTKDLIKVFSQKLDADLTKKTSMHSGKVNGQIQRKRRFEQNVSFQSRQMKLNLNSYEIDLIEDVVIKKQLLRSSSRGGKIYLENYNKKLKYFVLFDDVKVTEKVMLKGESYTRRAFAEKLEGSMSTSELILTGFPRVIQKDDVIKGNRITLRHNISLIEVDDASSSFKLEQQGREEK